MPFKQFLREYVDVIIVLQDRGKQREGSQRMKPFLCISPFTLPLMLEPGYLSVLNPLYTWLLYFISSFNKIMLIRDVLNLNYLKAFFGSNTVSYIRHYLSLNVHTQTHTHKCTQAHTYTSGLKTSLFFASWDSGLSVLPSLIWSILEPSAGLKDKSCCVASLFSRSLKISIIFPLALWRPAKEIRDNYGPAESGASIE